MFLKFAWTRLACSALAAAAWAGAQAPAYDVLIRGARIIDGTGNPWFNGDIAIRGGRVVAIGRLDGATAARVIDARGLVAAPGFIDLHTHSDLTLLADGNAESKVRDGVTLDVIGESTSVAPRDGLPVETVDGVRQDWSTFTEYFARVEKQGIAMNVISHVSAEQVRRVVMGYDDRPANAAQLDRMKKLMARSMEEGAWGLVTRFESGGPDHPDEIVELAKVAAAYGGNYTSHIGSEGFQQTKEIAFVGRVADEARIPPTSSTSKSGARTTGAACPGSSTRSTARGRRGWTSPPTSIRTPPCFTAGAPSSPCGCARAARKNSPSG